MQNTTGGNYRWPKTSLLTNTDSGEDRNALLFHWIKDRNSTEIEVLRFTRLVFGLGLSPFVLGEIIKSHLHKEHKNHPEAVEELRKSLYIDDVISRDDDIESCSEYKITIKAIFKRAWFDLHRWHSNIKELEEDNISEVEENDSTFAKQQLTINLTRHQYLDLAGTSQQMNLRWNFKN